MSFHGKETKETPEPRAARKFTYTDFGGRKHEVTATDVKFTSHHVCFWQDVPGEADRLVLAEANSQVHKLQEVSP